MNGLKRTPDQIEQRQKLCDELYWCIKNEIDMGARRGGLLDEVLDSFVYELSDKEKALLARESSNGKFSSVTASCE